MWPRAFLMLFLALLVGSPTPLLAQSDDDLLDPLEDEEDEDEGRLDDEDTDDDFDDDLDDDDLDDDEEIDLDAVDGQGPEIFEAWTDEELFQRVLIVPLVGETSESAGIGDLLEGFLASALDNNGRFETFLLDEVPPVEDVDARLYYEGCPPGQELGCQFVIGEVAEVDRVGVVLRDGAVGLGRGPVALVDEHHVGERLRPVAQGVHAGHLHVSAR